MNPPRRRGGPTLVGIIGPPASGKTTLAVTLAAALRAPVVRPRQAIRRYLAQHPPLTPLFPAVNDLGWVPDAAMRLAVRAELDAIPDDVHTVLLENLPWDALQLADLHRIAGTNDACLLLLHLGAPDEIISVRGSSRRVCRACGQPNRPQAPTTTAKTGPTSCAQCGADLALRADDQPDVLAKRVQIYYRRTATILPLVTAIGIPILAIDSTRLPEHVGQEAFDFIVREARSYTHDLTNFDAAA